MLSSLVFSLAALPAFGVTIDHIFIREEEREKIKEYLERPRPIEESATNRFILFLSIAHAIVFDRFFSDRFLSLKFFQSAAVISIISFCVVASVQILMTGGIPIIRWDTLQIAIIIAFVGFNVAFDYITIIQTKVFIDASLGSISIFRSSMFILSDLIVIMNTFILSYALFVMVFISMFFIKTDHMKFYTFDRGMEVHKTTDIPGYLRHFDGNGILSKLIFSSNFSGGLIPVQYPYKYDFVTVYFESTFDPNDDAEFVKRAILKNISRMNVYIGGGFESVSDVELARRLHSDDLRYMRDAPTVKDEDLLPIHSVSVSVSGMHSEGTSRYLPYTTAFSRADILEDAFPESLLYLQLVGLRGFIADTVSSGADTEIITLCLDKEKNVSRHVFTIKSFNVLEDCSDFITIDHVWHDSLTRIYATLGKDLEVTLVPFNTMFITSLLPTFLFYLAVVFLLFIKTIYVYVLKSTQLSFVKRYFLRSPFAFTGLIFGAILTAVGWL